MTERLSAKVVSIQEGWVGGWLGGDGVGMLVLVGVRGVCDKIDR